MKIPAMIGLAMAVAVSPGCNNKPPQPKTSSGSSSSGASAPTPLTTPGQRLDKAVDEAKGTASDAALTAKVKTALASDVGLKTLKIDVDANGGVVTLKGKVDSDDMKQRAQQAAQQVQGVTWVQNQISVAPLVAPKTS